jgi:AcrR family transcriptional regulator
LDVETILKATEDVLRRHGPVKASVVDVARVLGVSHGTVYRHFPSKAMLREAVTRRWIARSHEGLADVADDRNLAAPDRLRHWLVTVFLAKRAAALEDPELFDTYFELVKDQSDVIADHIADLLGQILGIVHDGISAGDFQAGDPERLARAIFDATARFHHPGHARDWRSDDIVEDLHGLCTLILNGLVAR